MSYKIEHDRPGCIGCGACAAVHPEAWIMAEDGKSDLAGSKHIEENGEIIKEELEISDDVFQQHKEAADVCPVNVIHIKDKDGNKII